MKQNGIDKLHRSLILNDAPTAMAGVFYTQLKLEDLLLKYRQVMANMIPDIPLTNFQERSVGSTLIPKKSEVTSFFERFKREIEENPPSTYTDWIYFHNRVAIYTYQFLNLATGHRPTVAAYSTQSDFDLTGRLCFIRDKLVTESKLGRIVPLTKQAVAQLNYYKNHVDLLVRNLASISADDSLVPKIAACLDPKEELSPFLFLFRRVGKTEKFGIKPPAPKTIEKLSQRIWPMPLNWNRHYLRTWLTAKQNDNMPSELIDAFMGHAQFGTSPENPRSCFCYSSLDEVRFRIEEMIEELELQPLVAR